MPDKFSVKVYMVVVAVEPAQRDQSKFLVTTEDDSIVFPNLYLNRESITKDIAANLLRDFTGVTQDWAVIFPFGVIDDIDPEKDSLAVLYGVFIPGVTRIRKENSRWITYADMEGNPDISPFIKKLAYEAIWRQV